MKVVGVDGCKGGWFAIVTVDEKLSGASFFASFTILVDAVADAKIVAVDIPIGLLEKGDRQADLEAKKFLEKKASSVFLTPPRKVLEEQNYTKANNLAQQLGKGVSKQAHGLRGKIFEVEPHAEKNTRIVEVHPEVSFREMAGRPLTSSKKTWDGLFERPTLLKKAGLDLAKFLPKSDTGAAPDDVVDAAAAAWTASRLAHGNARSIPESPTQMWKGRPIVIWR